MALNRGNSIERKKNKYWSSNGIGITFRFLVPFYPSSYFSLFGDADERIKENIRHSETDILGQTDMAKLRDQYVEVIRSKAIDRESLRKECDLVQSVIRAAIDKYDESKFRHASIKSDIICILSLIIAAISILFSGGFLDDVDGTKVASGVYSQYISWFQKMTFEDKVGSMVGGIFIVFCIFMGIYDLISFFRFKAKTRRNYLTAIQCFDVFKLALLKEETESQNHNGNMI